MEITATDLFTGPSVHAQRPVARYTLGQLDELPPGCLDQALQGALEEQLPGVVQEWESCAARSEGDASPLELNHLFEHVCIELLRRAGSEAGCVRAQQAQQLAPDRAVVACDEVEVAHAVSQLAAELLTSLLPTRLAPAAPDSQPFDFARGFAKFTRFAERTMLPVQDRELVRRARDRDVPVIRLIGRIIQLGHGRYQQRLSASKTTLTNVVSNDIASNKDYARRILGDLGLPVPRCERVYDMAAAVRAARRIGYPVVVKPNQGSMGEAVSVGMKNRREVRAAYRRAKAVSKSVLIEELVEGSDYRMLVVNGELLAAAQRVPGHVVGDGVRTVQQLVSQVNRDPRRGTGPSHSWTRIKLDDQADRLLAALGYTRRSIPSDGEVVFLRRNANTSDGGTAVDVTEIVHPDNRAIAVRAAKVIGLDVAGVDLLTVDITRSMWETGGRICEVNSRPGLRKHMWPATGEPRDVVTPIVDMLFPEGSPSRIPIVAVTGRGDTRTTARMLAHVLAASGRHVGLVAKRRVYIGGRRTGQSRLTAPRATRMILLDPEVDVAVLEMPPDEVLKHGLGCDAVDLSVVVPAADEAAEPSQHAARETVEAIRVVTRSTRGSILTSGDDGELDGALSLPGGATLLRIVPASREDESPLQPAGEPDRQLVSDGEVLRAYERGELQAEISCGAAADGDPAARARGRCALLAGAAALTLGTRPRKIQRGIASFQVRASRVARRRRRSTTRGKNRAKKPAREEASG